MDNEFQSSPEIADLKNQEGNKKPIFSWKRIGKIIGITIFVVVFGMAEYLGVNSRSFKILSQRWLNGNRLHLIVCDDLPFYTQGQKAFLGHQETIKQLKQAGAFNIEVKKIICPSLDPNLSFVKGDLYLEYKTRAELKQIENILGKDFFGIPYNGYKR
jgi:hypothetical protein